jgi:hypothetical protein
MRVKFLIQPLTAFIIPKTAGCTDLFRFDKHMGSGVKSSLLTIKPLASLADHFVLIWHVLGLYRDPFFCIRQQD